MATKAKAPAKNKIIDSKSAQEIADTRIGEMKDVQIVTAQEPHKRTDVDSLLANAVASGASIDTLERLMALRKELLAEQAMRSFNESMAAFQSECPVIEKKKEVKDNNKKLLYCYAPLDSIVSQVKALLQKYGFSYAIKTKWGEGSITVICIVKHKNGHNEESELQVPSTGGTSIMSGPQKTAAALTFAKRYAFCNAFGIMTGDEDTDAVQQHEEKPKEETKKPVDDELATRKKQMFAVWNEFATVKNMKNDEIAENRHKMMAIVFKNAKPVPEHADQMTLAQLELFIREVQAMTKQLKAKAKDKESVDTMQAAKEAFPEEKAATEPAKTPTQPAAPAKPSFVTAEELKGILDWISMTASSDELEEVWKEIIPEQVRLKEAKFWVTVHQAYMRQRVALKNAAATTV